MAVVERVILDDLLTPEVWSSLCGGRRWRFLEGRFWSGDGVPRSYRQGGPMNILTMIPGVSFFGWLLACAICPIRPYQKAQTGYERVTRGLALWLPYVFAISALLGTVVKLSQ